MKMTSSKRFAVRTALVTGTTLATIIGAQALASLDETAFSKTPPAVVEPAALSTQSMGSTPEFSALSETAAAAPDIVILRHAGQVPSAQAQITAPQPSLTIANPQPVAIQPPSPIQVAAPQPVAQAAPQQSSAPVARTRSSR